MNAEVTRQLTRARAQLIIDQPFFGQLALRLRLVETLSVSTLAVDGKSIFYNPEFVASMSLPLTKSALAHEVMHCVFEHFGRRGDRHPMKWNIAGDYVINLVLRDSGFEIGKGWLLNIKYADMTTDQVYALLPDNSTEGHDESNEQGPGPGEPGGPLDEVLPGDPNDVQTEMTDWKIATIQAIQATKGCGKLSNSLERFIEVLTTPQVNWREQLRRFVNQTSKDDYTWMRPNRRYVTHGFCLPSAYSENMGEITVAIDTSGSITQEMLNAFGAEITAIVQSVRPSKTTVIYCDARINHVDQFGPGEDLWFTLHGGGGTSFKPPFEYVSKYTLAPVCLIYLTDMYGEFPDEPEYPVLWCATSDVEGPFGQTIYINA